MAYLSYSLALRLQTFVQVVNSAEGKAHRAVPRHFVAGHRKSLCSTDIGTSRRKAEWTQVFNTLMPPAQCDNEFTIDCGASPEQIKDGGRNDHGCFSDAAFVRPGFSADVDPPTSFHHDTATQQRSHPATHDVETPFDEVLSSDSTSSTILTAWSSA
eukprot:3955268-Amphidinium_carterae.1